MVVALSTLNIYTGATLDTQDGTIVSENLLSGGRISLEGLRGTFSNTVAFGIRANTQTCYFATLTIGGPRVSQIYISTDGSYWSNKVYFWSVTSLNSIFYMKSLIGDNEDYGEDASNYLTLAYLSPV